MGRISVLLVLAALAATAQTLAPGKLLVATSKSTDPAFMRTVVLLLATDHDAAIGIVINRPPVGGPVPVGRNALVESRELLPKSKRLVDGVVWFNDPREFARLAPGRRARTYEGTCGWTLRELREEIRAGLWRVVDGSAALILDSRPETLWERLRGL